MKGLLKNIYNGVAYKGLRRILLKLTVNVP